MKYVLDRLSENSTWRGLIALATALGVALSPDQQSAIVAAGLGLIGLINVFPQVVTAIYTLLSLLATAGATVLGMVWRARRAESARDAVTADAARKYQHEAEIHAAPARPLGAVLDSMRRRDG